MHLKQKDDRKGTCLTMVSTNSTETAEEAKTAFATAIDSVVRMIEQDDEMDSRLRNQSTDLLALAIQAVVPVIRYVDEPMVLTALPIDVTGREIVDGVDWGRAAKISTGFEFGHNGVDIHLLRNGMFMLGDKSRTNQYRILHLPDLLHSERKTEEHVDLVMTLIEGLAKLFAEAIAKSDARRASLQDRAGRLAAAAWAFKTPTAASA